jgi:hypothetical protein
MNLGTRQCLSFKCLGFGHVTPFPSDNETTGTQRPYNIYRLMLITIVNPPDGPGRTDSVSMYICISSNTQCCGLMIATSALSAVHLHRQKEFTCICGRTVGFGKYSLICLHSRALLKTKQPIGKRSSHSLLLLTNPFPMTPRTLVENFYRSSLIWQVSHAPHRGLRDTPCGWRLWAQQLHVLNPAL